MEVFKSSERYECEELYRAREYNRVREYVAHKEIYRSAEVNIQPEGSLPKADRKKQQQSQLRKKLLMAGSSFSAVGAAVGAVIIIAATITAAVVLSVKETFSDITSYSIEVQFEIENEDAVELTATLKGGEKRLEYQLGGQDRVYFDFLEYSTEYTLEIADENDKVYFSQAYTTAAYRQEIFPVESGFSGYSILMQFAREDLTEDGYNVCFDGELLDGRLSKDSPYFRVNGLVPNTMHDLRIYDPMNGHILYDENISSGNVLYGMPVYINAQTACYDFSFSEFNGHPLEVYLDNKLLDVTLDEENPVFTFDLSSENQETGLPQLQFGKQCTLDIVDTQTGEHLYMEDITVPDVAVINDINAEDPSLPDSISRHFELIGVDYKEVNLSILLNDEVIESRTVQAIKQGDQGGIQTEDFENLLPNTQYMFRFTDEAGRVLYQDYVATGGYLYMTDQLSEYFDSQGTKVYNVPFESQSELYCNLPEGVLYEQVKLEINPEWPSSGGGSIVSEFNPEGTYGNVFTLYPSGCKAGEIYEVQLTTNDGTVLDRILIELVEEPSSE